MRPLQTVVLGGALVAFGCAPQTRSAEPAPYAPSFSYSPPSKVTPNSAGVSFSIVNAQYSQGTQVTQMPIFGELSAHLGSDLTEALAARGFTTRGPFGSYAVMTFPDKQNSDLVLEPNLEVLVRYTLTPHEKINLLGPNYLVYSGTISLGGRVSLLVNESLSNERMWVKNVDIPANTFTWQGVQKYSKEAGPPPIDVLMNDAGFNGPLGKELSTVYQQIMQAAWTYLDPKEMVVVKQQSQEVRRRWVSTSR